MSIVSVSYELAEDRRAAVAKRVPLASGLGLEISPGAHPLLDKSQGNILYCDRVDLNKLHNTDAYVPVDQVLGDRLIDEVFAPHSIDYMVSSHVIEHVPDFIQFLKSASTVLRRGGAMVNLIPDRRGTFDFLRETSTIEQIEDAHRRRLRAPDIRMAKDHYEKIDTNAPLHGLWDGTYEPRPINTPQQAAELIAGATDIHCWVFTPSSCRELLEHVTKNHLPRMQVAEMVEQPAYSWEFLVYLTFG
jgi:hypothetical protein